MAHGDQVVATSRDPQGSPPFTGAAVQEFGRYSERSRAHARQIRIDPHGKMAVDHGGYLRTCAKCGCHVFEKKGAPIGECPACVHGISPVNLPRKP